MSLEDLEETKNRLLAARALKQKEPAAADRTYLVDDEDVPVVKAPAAKKAFGKAADEAPAPAPEVPVAVVPDVPAVAAPPTAPTVAPVVVATPPPAAPTAPRVAPTRAPVRRARPAGESGGRIPIE